MDACLASPPRNPDQPVRLPGQAALARKRKALDQGVALYPGILAGLIEQAGTLSVDVPAVLAAHEAA